MPGIIKPATTAVFILLLLFPTACYRNREQQTTPLPGAIPTAALTPHPLSIAALKSRQWEPGMITVENQVAREDKYTGFVVSYQSEGNKIYALVNLPLADNPETKFPTVIVNPAILILKCNFIRRKFLCKKVQNINRQNVRIAFLC